MKTNQILQGDAFKKLKTLPDDSINCIITSPPYWGLRDYGTATWDGGNKNCDHKTTTRLKPAKSTLSGGKNTILKSEGFAKDVCPKCGAKRIDLQLGLEKTLDKFLANMLKVTAECQRVLKKDGVMFWNHGDCYGGSGKGGGNKNSWKGGEDKYGISGQGIAKCLMLQNWRLILKMIDEQGWILRNTIIWYKKNAMPSSVPDRLTNKYEPVYFLTKSKKYFFDLDAIRIPYETNEKRPDGLNRNRDKNYQGKYSEDPEYFQSFRARDSRKFNTKEGSKRREMELQGNRFGKRRPPQNEGDYTRNEKGKNPGDIWEINTQPFSEAHFATFPEKLVTPIIKAGCPKDGIVLDPFAGSGTTLLVTEKLRRKWIGIELNPKYIKIANKRMAQQILI